jgi:hypothetical protein
MYFDGIQRQKNFSEKSKFFSQFGNTSPFLKQKYIHSFMDKSHRPGFLKLKTSDSHQVGSEDSCLII